MSRILFAWEMGGNFGHVARDLPLALACRDAGHEVLLAASDLAACLPVARRYKLDFVQAPLPRLRRAPRSLSPAVNFADMLLQNGFCDRAYMDACLLGWRGLFKAYAPDLMVHDHAPRALLAAHIACLPVVLLGNGFEIPPDAVPLPSFRPWMDTPEGDLLRPEHDLVANINALLGDHGSPTIERLWDLYAAKPALIAYFPEFDHFGPRGHVEYVGMASHLPATRQVAWSDEARSKVIVYLRASVSFIENVFVALSQIDAEVVCVVPDLPEAWVERYPLLRFYREAVDLAQLFPRASLTVTHGSGTYADSISAGVPVLMVPSVIEQYLAAVPLERQGLGLILRKRESASLCLDLLRRLLTGAQFRHAARQLAARYSSFRPAHSVSRQLQLLEAQLPKA